MSDNYLQQDFQLLNCKKRFEPANISDGKGAFLNEGYDQKTSIRGRAVCLYRALTAIPMGLLERLAAVVRSAFALLQESFKLLAGHSSAKPGTGVLRPWIENVKNLSSNMASVLTGISFGLVLRTLRYLIGVLHPGCVYYDVSAQPFQESDQVLREKAEKRVAQLEDQLENLKNQQVTPQAASLHQTRNEGRPTEGPLASFEALKARFVQTAENIREYVESQEARQREVEGILEREKVTAEEVHRLRLDLDKAERISESYKRVYNAIQESANQMMACNQRLATAINAIPDENEGAEAEELPVPLQEAS